MSGFGAIDEQRIQEAHSSPCATPRSVFSDEIVQVVVGGGGGGGEVGATRPDQGMYAGRRARPREWCHGLGTPRVCQFHRSRLVDEAFELPLAGGPLHTSWTWRRPVGRRVPSAGTAARGGGEGGRGGKDLQSRGMRTVLGFV